MYHTVVTYGRYTKVTAVFLSLLLSVSLLPPHTQSFYQSVFVVQIKHLCRRISRLNGVIGIMMTPSSPATTDIIASVLSSAECDETITRPCVLIQMSFSLQLQGELSTSPPPPIGNLSISAC